MTAAGHDSLTAVAEWGRRCGQEVLARLGCPYDPFAGVFRAPGERTLRDVFAKLDPAAPTAAGFARLSRLCPPGPAPHGRCPDGGVEREQCRAHRNLVRKPQTAWRRPVFAVDGKCLRGAVRPDGSRAFVLSAVRHHDALTAALREIGAKTNEIPEFQPLMEQVPDADLVGAVITVDALHAQIEHAGYLIARGAHYLLTVKSNRPVLARQLAGLPWGKVPVRDRSTGRGHGREEVREIKVVTVDGPLFPYARQVARIRRRRRPLGAKDWETETVHVITGLEAHQASPAEIAAWARGHRTIESTHWIKDVTFGEDASHVRTQRTPSVLSVLRDLVRSSLRQAGWTNITVGRRAHTQPAKILALHDIP